jgi:hypothetical protein
MLVRSGGRGWDIDRTKRGCQGDLAGRPGILTCLDESEIRCKSWICGRGSPAEDGGIRESLNSDRAGTPDDNPALTPFIEDDTMATLSSFAKQLDTAINERDRLARELQAVPMDRRSTAWYLDQRESLGAWIAQIDRLTKKQNRRSDDASRRS